MCVSRDVVFDELLNNESSSVNSPEKEVLVLPKTTRNNKEAIDIDGDSDEESGEENDELIVQQEERVKKEDTQQAEALDQRQLRNCANLRMPRRYQVEADFVEYKTPETYDEAVKGPEGTEWMAAIKNELQAHKKNNM